MTTLAHKVQKFTEAQQVAKLGPVGVHFSEEHLHAVQLRQSANGQLSLRSWVSLPYPEMREELLSSPERLNLFVRQALRRGKFRGRKVVTAMAPEKLKISSLKYSADPRISDAEKIYRLMSERLDGDIGDYVLDYLPVRVHSSETERVALVATCKREDVLGYLEALAKARLQVEALEISPVAIKRLIGAMHIQNESDNTMVINFGGKKSYLTIISGRRLMLDQEVNFGEKMLIEKIAGALDLSKALAAELALQQGLVAFGAEQEGADRTLSGAESSAIVEIVRPLFSQLVDEITRVCRYAASETQGGVIDQVYAIGSIARWPGAVELLSRAANIPVAEPLSLETFLEVPTGRGDAQRSSIGPELAVATGLALRGLRSDD